MCNSLIATIENIVSSAPFWYLNDKLRYFAYFISWRIFPNMLQNP